MRIEKKILSILKKDFNFFYILRKNNEYYFTNHKFLIIVNNLTILNFEENILYKYENKKINKSNEYDKMNLNKIENFIEIYNKNSFFSEKIISKEFEFILKELFDRNLILSSKYYNFLIELDKNNFLYDVYLLNNDIIYINSLNKNLKIFISLMKFVNNFYYDNFII